MSVSQRYYGDAEPVPPKGSDRKPSKSSPSTSAASSRTSSAVSLEPTPAVAEWCHQMHLVQNRKYEWCQGCHPKVPTVKVPSEKILRQQRMTNEPTHAYQ